MGAIRVSGRNAYHGEHHHRLRDKADRVRARERERGGERGRVGGWKRDRGRDGDRDRDT